MLVRDLGYLCWTYKQTRFSNVLSEWNSFVCRELNTVGWKEEGVQGLRHGWLDYIPSLGSFRAKIQSNFHPSTKYRVFSPYPISILIWTDISSLLIGWTLFFWMISLWNKKKINWLTGFFFLTFYFVLWYSKGTHVSILPQTPLPFRLPHNTEQSSMCYTVDSRWLSILNIAVHTCWSQTP